MEKSREMKKQIVLTFRKAKQEGNESFNKTANEMALQYLKEETNTNLSDEKVIYLWFYCFRRYEDVLVALEEAKELLTLYKEMEELEEK